MSYIRLCPLGTRLITAIQQHTEVNEVEHLIGTSGQALLEPDSRWSQPNNHEAPFSLSSFAGQARVIYKSDEMCIV